MPPLLTVGDVLALHQPGAPWPPSAVPERFAKVLRLFSPHRDGLVRRVPGKGPLYVCGKTTPLEDIEGRWEELRRKLAGQAPPPEPDVASVRWLLGKFISRCRKRVETGRPKPMSPFTLRDYLHVLKAFGRHVGLDRPVASLIPEDFERFGETFAGREPSSLARAVGYVTGVFRWGHRRHGTPLPSFGDFTKPPAAHVRERRIGKTKSYTTGELAALWAAANETERCWMMLGLTGALDNSDLAHLSAEVLDLGGGLIDYRRRKSGKVRRVIPIHPELAVLLRAYRRPAAASPEHAGLFFLTPEGLPLVRTVSGGESPVSVDYVSQRWRDLMERAGLREKSTTVSLCAACGQPRKTRRLGRVHYCVHCGQAAGRVRHKVMARGDGRGFRGLRTTFGNLVPPGYGDERRIIMGHGGDTFTDHYLERFGVARLGELVAAVWHGAFTSS